MRALDAAFAGAAPRHQADVSRRMPVSASRCVHLAVALLWISSTALAQDTVAVHDPLADAAKQIAEQFVANSQPRKGVVGAVDETVDPEEVYITLGNEDGIVPGQAMSLQEAGEAIIVGGETVGYKESPIGFVEVVRVQSGHLCVAKVVNLLPGKKPAKDQVAYLQTVPHTLAVMSFLRPDQAPMALGTEFAEKLELALNNTGQFTIVERSRFQSVMEEAKLGISDLFDPTKTAPFGKQLQAQGVVLGTIGMTETTATVVARVVDIATGSQTLSASAVMLKTKDIESKYVPAVRVQPVPNASGTPGSREAVTPTGVKVLYVGTGRDFVHDEQLADVIRAAGFQVDAKPALPDALTGYDVVILEQPGRATNSLASTLYAFVGAGKGLVLTGGTLGELLRYDSGAHTNWLGCSETDNAQYPMGGRAQAARTNPFGALPSVAAGAELFGSVPGVV